MDTLPDLLEELKHTKMMRGHFLGLLHVVVGRRISKKDGTLVSGGVTWRELANHLKKLRWDTDAVSELNLQIDDLPPRDRERFWYSAIIRARVDSAEAHVAGDRFAAMLKNKGYEVGPAPGSG